MARRLRYARRLAGFTRAELAAALGISVQAIDRCENGERRLSPALLAAASSTIEVPLAFFFEEDLPVATVASGDPTVLTPREAHIIRRLRTLDRDQQDEIFDLVQIMSQRDDRSD